MFVPQHLEFYVHCEVYVGFVVIVISVVLGPLCSFCWLLFHWPLTHKVHSIKFGEKTFVKYIFCFSPRASIPSPGLIMIQPRSADLRKIDIKMTNMPKNTLGRVKKGTHLSYTGEL